MTEASEAIEPVAKYGGDRVSDKVATKLLVVEPGRFRVIDGNYDTYLHLVKQGLAKDARAAVAAASSVKGHADKASRQVTALTRHPPWHAA